MVTRPEQSPDISGISLSPEGTDFSDCHREVTAQAPDVSGISLSPEGSPMQDEDQRRDTPAAPDTSHITLDS